MAKHRIIGDYDNTREHWLAYTEIMQQYFAANNVRSAEQQQAILLSSVGASTYQRIKNLLAPSKPASALGIDLLAAAASSPQVTNASPPVGQSATSALTGTGP